MARQGDGRSGMRDLREGGFGLGSDEGSRPTTLPPNAASERAGGGRGRVAC
jgi:hypothetical protein